MRAHAVAVRRADLPTGEGHEASSSPAPSEGVELPLRVRRRRAVPPSTARAWRCASSTAGPTGPARPRRGSGCGARWSATRSRPACSGPRRPPTSATASRGCCPLDRWIFLNPDLTLHLARRAARRVDRPRRAHRPERPGHGHGRERRLRRATAGWARGAEPAAAAPRRVTGSAPGTPPPRSTRPLGDHNVAALHEAIAAAVPDRECVVAGGVRRTWAETTDRTRRLAAVLADAGHRAAGGARRPRRPLAPWESPHDHVALYLHNGHEYLEGMLGAWKARAAGGQRQLPLRGRRAALRPGRQRRRGRSIYHGAFAPTLAEVLADLPDLPAAAAGRRRLGRRCCRAPVGYEDALAAATPRPPDGPVARRPLHPLHRRHHRHAQGHAVAPGRLPGHRARRRRGRSPTIVEPRARSRARPAQRCRRRRSCTAPPTGTPSRRGSSGGTVIVQDDPTRLDPADVLGHVRPRAGQRAADRGRPLRPAAARRARRRTTTTCRRCASCCRAAPCCPPPVKDRLVDRLPGLRIVDVLGSSETGRQAVSGPLGGVPARAHDRGAVRGPHPAPRARRRRDRLAGPGGPRAARLPRRPGQDRTPRSR